MQALISWLLLRFYNTNALTGKTYWYYLQCLSCLHIFVSLQSWIAFSRITVDLQLQMLRGTNVRSEKTFDTKIIEHLTQCLERLTYEHPHALLKLHWHYHYRILSLKCTFQIVDIIVEKHLSLVEVKKESLPSAGDCTVVPR